MKNKVFLYEFHEKGDSFSVFDMGKRGPRYSMGPICCFTVLKSGVGTEDYWKSPVGRFTLSGLATTSNGEPIL